ncbi:vomeronasal type-2 receptor 26-like [Phyllobates terribilis]
MDANVYNPWFLKDNTVFISTLSEEEKRYLGVWVTSLAITQTQTFPRWLASLRKSWAILEKMSREATIQTESEILPTNIKRLTVTPKTENSCVQVLTNNSEICHKCPDEKWSNEAKDACIPKIMEFLSYEQDVMAAVFSSMSGLFLIITLLVIGIFIFFSDTPIVKANNRNISFILLLSLKMSLFCVFLFIGRPNDTTCMVRQISIGVTFTVAVSSILAKSIMVSIAFKATRPGSSWRRWMGITLPNSVVLICSFIQFLNGVIWLSVSPPFQEMDMDTYPGKIIIQCNEGSVMAFYFMLGYMGFLAAVSFVLAFMVRTLPDIYNEAKYITFSMLVFCSVWICAIPAYLSSKGKNMVMVQIFSILASQIGILGCIFFPKCYNIIMRPEMNSRRQFLEKH